MDPTGLPSDMPMRESGRHSIPVANWSLMAALAALLVFGGPFG
jgi:hypothetical protein